MLSRFNLIPERHGETDRRTHRQTERIAISVSRVSVLTRDKNFEQIILLSRVSTLTRDIDIAILSVRDVPVSDDSAIVTMEGE